MAEVETVEHIAKTASETFSEGLEYESVYALLIYWKESDLNPEEEISVLRALFEKDFNYMVTTFPIPTNGGQQRLNLEICQFVSQWSNKPNTLIIVYYTGHCSTSEKGEARWAAVENGGPTLSWSACQQNLFGTAGDVLLILDCCEGAVYSKGSKPQGRFEILAASAKGVKTPGPGKWSFTSFMMRELSQKKDVGTTVRELFSLLSEGHQVQETPYWGDLARNNPASIPLKRLSERMHPGFRRKASSQILFRVSLNDDPTGLEIANWLKTAPPKSVTAVDIEAIVLKARTIQRQIDPSAFPHGSIFRKLPQATQMDILRQFSQLDTTMNSSAASAHSSLAVSDDVTIARAYESVQSAVSTVCTAVETPLLLDLPPEDLDNALRAACSWNSLELPLEKSTLHHSETRFRSGSIEKRAILAKFFAYDPDPNTGEPYEASVDQICSMAAQLYHPKRISFHILPCVGYVHNRINHEFGLLFELPLNTIATETPRVLSDLYESHKFTPLGDRIRLAYHLIVALENFHRVGWVHKDFRSGNIGFLRSNEALVSVSSENHDASTTSNSIDFSAPWLFGFEYARATAAGTRLEEDYNTNNNLYRHPNRWGRPAVKFPKAYDVYSLGIVLYEIASWKDIKEIMKVSDNRRITAGQVRNHVERDCLKKLPFQVGEVFASIVMACLDFEKTTAQMNDFEAQKYFQDSILNQLQLAVGKV
ncbi:MAG: hypothetical protein M1821_001176 [Bathelium mastoideum]|nr:MAG: hypothetical protein M1821_001176 [Bathelium mastoideum]